MDFYVANGRLHIVRVSDGDAVKWILPENPAQNEGFMGPTFEAFRKAAEEATKGRWRYAPDSMVSDAVSRLREMTGADDDPPDALRTRYREEIEGWKWEAVRRAAENSAEEDPDGDDGGRVGRDFLGTVFGLYPSGKYYTCFACSNLEPCGRCGGAGSLRNVQADPEGIKGLWEARAEAIAIHKGKADGYAEFPDFLKLMLREIDEAIATKQDTLSCPHCEGEGSREALEDSIFQEELEAVADSHGMSIESTGEGDPCDVFAVLYLPPEEPTEDGTEEAA